MARTTKKKETASAPVATRAEKKDATKNIIRELLSVKPYKHNELIDEVAKNYTERFGGEETENVNDVKGRVGSVLDIMKKESDVAYDGGMYALKARLPVPLPVKTETDAANKPEKEAPKTEAPKKAKTTRSKAKKTNAEEVKTEEITKEAKTEEKPVKKSAGRKTKKQASEEKKEEPVLPELSSVKTEETEETPAPKKRGRKPKAKADEAKEKRTEKPVETPTEKPVETPAEEELPNPPVTEPVRQEPIVLPEAAPQAPKAETGEEMPEKALVVKEKGEVAAKSVVMDMSFLFGDVKATTKPQKTEIKELPKAEIKTEKTLEKKEDKAVAPVKAAAISKPAQSAQPVQPVPVAAAKSIEKTRLTERKPMRERTVRKPAEKPLTAEEKLKENFLKKMRTLGGDYFEYYSVYLLERYSMKNGRRLEGMKISGGDHDGGIDGEIELTDKLGFKETIYIQSKNWNPEKGDEKLWVVGETLLQQFIGACMCRQAKDGKQNCRGIFITTSRFTPEARRILDDMSDKIVGYDGNDLFDAAKECEFGLLKKNGEWVLDERLLSGTKAFFNMI